MVEEYGHTILVSNAREALFKTAHDVLAGGLMVQPRGLNTRELRHMTVVVDDPSDWSCAGINAGWSPKLVAVEAAQLVGGFSDPAWALTRVPNFEPFLNETGQFDGAYGPRVGRVLHDVVRRIKNDYDTRQAIIPVYGPNDAEREQSKDYPCTLSLHFLVRRGRLDLDVSMRSNDVDWGLKHDMSQFMILQCSVADVLGIEPGVYAHTSNSMHLYERSWEWASALCQVDETAGGHRVVDEKLLGTPLDVPNDGFRSIDGSVDNLWHRIECIAYDTALPNETPTEKWFREKLRV